MYPSIFVQIKRLILHLLALLGIILLNRYRKVSKSMMTIILTAILVIIVTSIIIALTSKAVIFSKVTFSLLAALIAHNQSPMGNSGFISYISWFAIFMVGCLILCLAPRINYSFLFLCNTLITHIISVFAVGICYSWFFDNQTPSIIVEVIVKVICLIVSVIALADQAESTKVIRGTNNGVLIFFQRIIASFIYAIALSILICASFNNLYKSSLVVTVLVFGIAFALAYLLDGFVFAGRKTNIKIQTSSTSAVDDWIKELVDSEEKERWIAEENEMKMKLAEEDEREWREELFEEERRAYEWEKEEEWHREWMDQAARDRENGY